MSDTADSTLGDGDSYRQSTPTTGPSPPAAPPTHATHAHAHFPQHPPPLPPPPSASAALSDISNLMKVTRGHSCILCQQRKVRCDKSKPCSNCVKAGVECRVVPPQPPRRRKKRVSERDLVERLRQYEALLTQHGIEFDGLGPDVKITDPGTVQDGDELDTEFVRHRDSPVGDDPEIISSPGEKPHAPRAFKWFPFQKEFRTIEESLRDSSDDDDMGSNLNSAYDKMFDNNSAEGFPFLVGSDPRAITGLHPPAVQIFQLWQVYLDNVNPILKMTHTPTLQSRIIEASANLERVSKSLEALMFSIYLMAITSLQDEEVTEMFNEDRSVLLKKYCVACQQALLNAGFMRNPDLTILQAFTLYLFGVRPFIDPRSLFCLSGIAVRLAWRLGVHRDGQQFGLSPFEVEERRRLWWTLAGFDRRIGEITGSTLTAISTGGDCKLPLNINDADLHVHAKDAPTPHTGATEMLFSLTRLEFSKAPGGDKMKTAISDPHQTVGNLADHRLTSYLERLSTHMEDTYLKFCDPKIPLHFYTIMSTRVNMCKLKILAGFFRSAMNAPNPLPPVENEELFIESIKLLEYDCAIHASENLKGYFWYSALQFPFPAYICLIKELRKRTTGELCERAWAAIFENHERRQLLRQMRSPMHTAFSTLFVKAWDAREAAESQMGRTLAPPPLITAMRQLVARMGLAKAKSKSPDPSSSAHATPSPAPGMSPSQASTQHPSPIPASQPGSYSMPQPATTHAPPSMPLYPGNPTPWSAVNGLGAPRQFSHAFADINFGGGDVDWQSLLTDYGGLVPQQEFAAMTAVPQQHDPNVPVYWQ